MTTKYIQEGATIDITAGSTISSGDVFELADTASAMLVVALTDIANGSVGTCATEGVYTLPKVSAAVFAQGAYVYWDTSANAVDDDQLSAATGDFICGTAWVAGANTETTAQIKLMGHATVIA